MCNLKYIFHKRFKGGSLSGVVNIPATTECEENQGLIFVRGSPVFFCTSENAHKHVSANSDGCGLQRGFLSEKIRSLMQKKRKSSSFFSRIDNDKICKKYKRTDSVGVWLWNHDFYNAPIEDLEHIYSIVKKS